MSELEEYFTQMAGTDADKRTPRTTPSMTRPWEQARSRTWLAAWNARRSGRDDMEREFRAEVKSCSTTWSADSKANCP